MGKSGLIPLRFCYYTVWRKRIAKKGFPCSVAFVTGGVGQVLPSEAPPLHGPGGCILFLLPACTSSGPNHTHFLDGSHFSPPKFYRGQSGGRALDWGQGWGIGKNLPCPRPVSRPWWGILPGARVLWGSGGPVMNTNTVSFGRAGWRTRHEVYFFLGCQSFNNKCYIEISANSVNI